MAEESPRLTSQRSSDDRSERARAAYASALMRYGKGAARGDPGRAAYAVGQRADPAPRRCRRDPRISRPPGRRRVAGRAAPQRCAAGTDISRGDRRHQHRSAQACLRAANPHVHTRFGIAHVARARIARHRVGPPVCVGWRIPGMSAAVPPVGALARGPPGGVESRARPSGRKYGFPTTRGRSVEFANRTVSNRYCVWRRSGSG